MLKQQLETAFQKIESMLAYLFKIEVHVNPVGVQIIDRIRFGNDFCLSLLHVFFRPLNGNFYQNRVEDFKNCFERKILSLPAPEASPLIDSINSFGKTLGNYSIPALIGLDDFLERKWTEYFCEKVEDPSMLSTLDPYITVTVGTSGAVLVAKGIYDLKSSNSHNKRAIGLIIAGLCSVSYSAFRFNS